MPHKNHNVCMLYGALLTNSLTDVLPASLRFLAVTMDYGFSVRQ